VERSESDTSGAKEEEALAPAEPARHPTGRGLHDRCRERSATLRSHKKEALCSPGKSQAHTLPSLAWSEGNPPLRPLGAGGRGHRARPEPVLQGEGALGSSNRIFGELQVLRRTFTGIRHRSRSLRWVYEGGGVALREPDRDLATHTSSPNTHPHITHTVSFRTSSGPCSTQNSNRRSWD
jgi:hypothetical protein